MDYFIIDEADSLLESGEEKLLLSLSKQLFYEKRENDLKHAQIIFVSATLTNKLKIFLEITFAGLTKMLVTSESHINLSHIKHFFVSVGEKNRLELLETELKRLPQKNYKIIFCNTVASVRAVDYYLKSKGLDVISLHSDMPVRLRASSFERFRSKAVNILITSDLSSRGLDFPHLDNVINFDFPHSANDYLHRVGRAGRAGKFGTAISLYKNSDQKLIDKLKDSYENGTPLELTESNYAIRKKEDTPKLKRNPISGEDAVPDTFKRFMNEQPELKQDHIKKYNTTRPRDLMKKKPDFKRKKIIDLKKSLKKQIKITPNNKRVVFLKKEIKNINKERIAIKKGIPLKNKSFKRKINK